MDWVERELQALSTLAEGAGNYTVISRMPPGVGRGTLDRLVARGLARTGQTVQGGYEQVGWTITPEGLRVLDAYMSDSRLVQATRKRSRRRPSR